MSEICLRAPYGANKEKRRRGRGQGTGLGCTSGKGNKGQNARSGGGTRPGFEGGQMPLYRRIAQRGFSNYNFKENYAVVNLVDLNNFEEGTEVTREKLQEKGFIKRNSKQIKILAKGELQKRLIVLIDAISKQARAKIEKAGGEVRLCKPVSKKKKKRVNALKASSPQLNESKKSKDEE